MSDCYTKEQRKEYNRKYREANRELLKRANRDYYRTHPELFAEYRKRAKERKKASSPTTLEPTGKE